MNSILSFKIAIQTFKDNFKTTIILTGLFGIMAVVYAGMFPSFKDLLDQMAESGGLDPFSSFFGPAAMDMNSYVGFLYLEMYQIFIIIILAIVIGFIASSIVSKEVELKTIDLFMSNPVSRKQIIFEKFIGLIPMVLIINFITMIAIIFTTSAIGETLDFGYLFLTHIILIPYLLAIVAIGILISVIIDEKMKGAIIMIAVIIAMYVYQTMGQMISSLEFIKYFSLMYYTNAYEVLKFGKVDVAGFIILSTATILLLIITMIYFEHKDLRL
ncbi:MAG: ABC transporter permease subunit [Thermoplasmatales archaeon]|nr:MAG: ABC transporter permease subunit [Thermoplasmatales archaeon]